MADTQSNIQVNIDTTQALASIKNLQRQISAFHSSMAKGGAAANAVSTQLQQTLINSINATGQFSAGIRTIRTTTESFTNSLEKNKFSLGEYFRYAGGATKTFGRLFKTEHDTINKVARENVKDLQTQYIRLGRDASGAMKSIAVRPLALDMTDLGTRTQIAAQKQAILNQLLKQGSTNLLNFGKNTQWAGRQLMVGFTLPLIAVGSAASKTFMDMEAQAIRFKKVYGDLFTSTSESQAALKDIQELGKEFTKYGIAVSTTVGLAAEAAAAGFKGVDLQRQTAAATRLSILGQVESQKALETTIALQNAFSMSSENLAESIDFLNAVENQTVLSLDDISTAIPKAAPVVQQLGGDVKDLAFLMTAMKEGGINASEGANALKSGLASLINPTGKANDMLLSFGINAKKIVLDNKGDLKKTVVEFATALNMLDPLNRAQAIEQMFGKFQFARLSTLFANVTKEGTQASRVLDLAGASVQELAGLAEKELGMTSESAMNKFKGAVEDLKLSLIPLGEQFLKAVTPIAEFITKILDKFNGLSDNTKKIIVVITSLVAGLGPVLLMTAGLVMNGLANMIKLFAFLKSAFNKTGRATTVLGTEVQYMTTEQRNAAAVAASLDQVHTKLQQTFTSETAAVNALTRAYQRAVAAQSQFVPVAPPITRGPIRKFATGKPATVGGTGNTDSELALLMPGETVIPTAMSKKYAPLINAMIAGNIPGYEFGKTRTVASHIEGFTPGQLVPTLSDPIMKKVLSVLPDVGVSVQVLSTTADGLVTVSGAIETSLQNLATTLSENNVENATAIGTGEFAGTTTPTSSERNLMLNSAGIAGEPLTFEQAQEASGRAQAYVDKPVANETDNTRAQKEEARRLVQEQVEFERSLVGLSQQEAEAKKLDFTRTKATQALEYTLMQKGLSAEEASTVAKQKIAEADKAVEQLTKKAKTDLEKRKIKEAAYQATLLKEMGAVAGYDEKKTKTTVFNRTQLNAVPRDMAKGQVQFGTPYAPGEKVPSGAAVFGSGKSFMGVKGKRVSRSQSAVVDLSSRDAYYADREKIRSGFKKQGSDAAKAFQDGFKSVKTPDPYVASRDRKSPHRLAAQDGRDDARAYAEARDKEAKRQSGRARRAATRPQGPAVAPVVTKTPRKPGPATRPQGPAPIGATPQPGMTILPIVPIGPDTPPDPDAKPKKSIAGKMTGLGGGMGLLGLNMGISMLPNFAGKDVIQGGLAGANLGMMFGPYGMAAGAAIGLVTTALGNLIEKQKQHKAMTEAMFKSSASVAEFFGNAVVNTTMEVGRLSSATLAASSSTENLAKSFGYTNEELKRFSDLVNSLPKGDPLKDVLVGLEDVSDPEEIKRIIENFVTTQVAVGQTLPEQAQKIYDLILAQSGNQSMVGQSFYNFKTQSEAVSATLKNASKNSVDLGNSLIQLTGAASNSSSLIFIKSIIDGIATSTISAAQGLNAMYYAYLRIGNQGAADSLQNLRRIQGLTLAEINDLMVSASQGFNYPVGKDTTREQILKAQAEFKKTLKEEDPVESGIKPYQDLADEKTSSIKKEIDLLKKRKKIIDDQIKKEKQITDELKKQNDYRDKQLKIDKDIVEAKIRGDYIQAAILLQEKTSLTDEFNKENQLSALQARSDALQQQIEERQSVSDDMVAAIQSTTEAVTTGSANIVEAVKEAGGFPSTDGDGSFKAPFTVASDKASIKSYIESEKPSAGITNEGTSVGTVKPSAIDAAKAYDETFGEKYTRLTQPGLKTEMQMLEDYIRTQLVFPPDKKYLFVEIKGGDGLFYKFKVAKDKNAKDGFIRVGNPIEKASGGAIRGAGTGTSDSIPAYLSNGEYVIKAKSVKKYGTETFDALNAGRFATGGQIGRSASSYIPRLNDGGNIKDGFMQRWSKSISGSPLAEMMGTAQLLRLISGQGKKGDKLGASMAPLSLLGSGFGSKIMGNLGKSAFYLPNKINQMINQRKVNSMLKSGVFHGSQPVGFRGEEYLQGTNILDGSMSTDPFHGMGFYGTTSKAEASLYASGYNSTNNWGESFGSMNQIVGAPRGKYVDFTRGPKSLKWQDYGLAKALGKSMPENLGDLMNAQGLTGGIMNRISSGRTPADIMYAKWLAFSNSAGVMTKEIPGYAGGGPVGFHKGGPVGHRHGRNLPGSQPSSVMPPSLPDWLTDEQKPESTKDFLLKQLMEFRSGSSVFASAAIGKNLFQKFQSRESYLNTFTPDDPNSDEDGPTRVIRSAKKDMKINYLDVRHIGNFSVDDRKRNLQSIFAAAEELTNLSGVQFKVLMPGMREHVRRWPYDTVLPISFVRTSKEQDNAHVAGQASGDLDNGHIELKRAKVSDRMTSFTPWNNRGSKYVAMHEIIHLFQEEYGSSGYEEFAPGMSHSYNPFNIMNAGLPFSPFTIVTNQDIEAIRKLSSYYDQKFLPMDAKKAKGGLVKKYATGGMIRGAGTPTSDSIPAYLSNGEYVIQADSVKKYGVGALDALNAGRFATGGQVGRSASSYIPRLNDGGIIPGYAGGGIVGKLLGGIGKAISKLFVGKSMGKPIKSNEVETFLSDTLGGATLPKIKKQELPAGVGGQYIPRFSDPASDYENLLPHILLNSKYKVQGNTAIHETMHHFDMDVMHDSFRRTIAKLRKDGKTDLADEYESLFVTAENKQKGMGLAVWEDRAITLEDYDSLTYFGGAAEAFADENTFKAYTKFMSSPKIKDKKLALKIGNPYGPGFSTDSLRGYFKTYSQFEHNALNMPMRLNPSFLRGLVENSPNMPQKTRDVYLAWAEGLQRFKPPARSNPDEIRNSLQWQNFKKYITDNGLDKAKGFHDGGPVGHKHPSTSYSPAPMSAAAKETIGLRSKLIKSGYANSQYLPRLVDPTSGVSPFNIPSSAGSTATMYSPATGLFGDPNFTLERAETKPFEPLDNAFKAPFKFLWKAINPSEAPPVDKQTEKSKYMREQMAIAWDMMHKVNPAFKLGSWLVKPIFDAATNIGAGDGKWNDYTSIAAMFAGSGIYKGTATAGITGIKSLVGAAKGATAGAKAAKLRATFEAMKAEGKLLEPEGIAARVELARYEALMAAKLNNFTPLMDLRTATSKKLIAENQALPAVIEEPFELGGKPFIYRFTKAPLHDSDAPVIDNFLATIKDGKSGLGHESVAKARHQVEVIDPLTWTTAAGITYDPITGAIGYRYTTTAYQRQGLSEFLYNKAAEITRIRHSRSLSDTGRPSAPKIGGFMSTDDIYNLPGMSSLAGPFSLKTNLQEFIQQSIKPKITKKPKKPKKPKKSGGTSSAVEDRLAAASTIGPQHDGLLRTSAYLGENFRPEVVAWFENPFRTTANFPYGYNGYVESMALPELERLRVLEDAARIPGVMPRSTTQDELAAWRNNTDRTYSTYPYFLQGLSYVSPDDLFDLQRLTLTPDYPAGFPWAASQEAYNFIRPFDRGPIGPGDMITGATGGFLDKGKLRVPKFANGGLIKGPGTGISDSIQAGFGYAGGGSIRVSNGEYVVKASSVRDYGVKTMDAINNGTARVGTESGGTVYNINMPVTSNNANPEIVANEVMRKLKLEVSKNNKTNRVGG